MLQQTRVAVVKERYKQFLRQFPSVSRLAQASEESVLAAWSGLGYYRRARALRAACKHIHSQGAFPRSAAELAELPGIGRYTAAAVSSIAFGEPAAVVDGNVKRVLQRLIGKELSTDAYWRAAEELLQKRRPGDFNQAMMELGATVCVPGEPLCTRCPVIKFCASPEGPARKNSFAQANATVPRRKATLGYLLAQKDGAILLQQRAADVSLMPEMWELPQLAPGDTKGRDPALRLRHSITTTDYSILVFLAARRKPKRGSWVLPRSINRLPLTGLTRKILRKLELLR
jgi:A/G-specific adenine glycosylase